MTIITEKEVGNLKDIRLQYKKSKYPIPLDGDLPKMYFVGLFVGSRGTGKTYAAVQLLKKYERIGIRSADSDKKLPQRILLFSPTVEANPVFTCLKNLDEEEDIHTRYSDKKLIDAISDIKRELKATKKYPEDLKLWRKFTRSKDVDRFSVEEIFRLEMMDFSPPIQPKYPDGVVNFMVLDDLIGTEAFKAIGKSALTNLCLKNRHLGINILIMAQNLKAIPKSIRINTSLFVIFRFASKKVVEDLSEEVSNVFTLAEFERVYNHATGEGGHNCLVMDFTDPGSSARFFKNFSTKLCMS